MSFSLFIELVNFSEIAEFFNDMASLVSSFLLQMLLENNILKFNKERMVHIFSNFHIGPINDISIRPLSVSFEEMFEDTGIWPRTGRPLSMMASGGCLDFKNPFVISEG